MEAIALDRKHIIMLLKWLKSGLAPVDEIEELRNYAVGDVKQMSDEEIEEELIRIEKSMDGEVFGGYRFHYLPESREKIK